MPVFCLHHVERQSTSIHGRWTRPVGGAADACRAIDCRIAIGYHWGDIVGSQDDAQAFDDHAPCRVRLLQPGETVEI
ncbi:MAG: hypothetical protein GVY16_11730 [Planctomycetes bacterium]|jgi:hypothetical protein|nr:hypothetical protein [Planctomycetota bacterium]